MQWGEYFLEFGGKSLGCVLTDQSKGRNKEKKRLGGREL
jgi:hypothetical protein